MSIFQNVTKGSCVKGGSILLVLAGAEGPYATKWGVFGHFLTGIPLWCFGVVASAGGILFFLWPMIYGSEPSIYTKQAKTKRMLFLYLRPFELDARNILQLMVGASAGALVYTGLLDGIWWVVSFVPLYLNISKEQAFKDAFEPLGEFSAFGKPDERLQPIGAWRIYAGPDWKQRIGNYMTQARLVIVRPGSSASVLWEIEQVLKTVPPQQILFYLRFRGRKKKREKAYAEFRNLVQKTCPAKLPERQGEFPYLIFDAYWNAYFIREANRPGELARQFISHSGDINLDRWRPVFNALNLELPYRSNNWFDKVRTGFTWLTAFFAVIMVVGSTLIGLATVMRALALYLLSKL